MFSKYMKRILETLSNPFEFFCLCISLEENLFKTKIAYVQDHQDDLKSLLIPSIQIKAFEICKILKLNVLQDVIVKAFSLTSAVSIIVPLLKMEIEKKSNLTDVSSMVKKLHCQSHFDLNELIMPLFFQNKILEMEKLLDLNTELQKEFLSLLDKLVGNEVEISDLLLSCNVKQLKGQMSPKILCKLGLRLLKKYNIDTGLCPNIMHRSKLSSLRYLFMRCYHQNELSIDSLTLFAVELSENDTILKTEILDLFLEYCDIYSGFLFVQKANIPQSSVPHQIKYLQNNSNKLEEERKRHENNHLKKSKNDFYMLSIPYSSICQIETIQEFNIALEDLKSCSVLGIDTEWKPTLQFDKEEELMLIQIATSDKVYLFDMLSLQTLLTSDHWGKIGELFSNSNIRKITYSFTGDKKCLATFDSQLRDHLKRMANVIDLNDTKKVLVDHYPQIFSYINSKPEKFSFKGLSEMVYLCFGKPLDKMEQCSYWSIRPLSRSQVVYAALDAFCLLDIYNYLNEMSLKLGFEDWISLQKQAMDPVTPTKKSSKSQTTKFKSPKNKNKIKNPQLKEPKQNIPASLFKVVCDTMLQGLGKHLRSCNIDTEILSSYDHHEKCIEHFKRDSRVILTRGNVYHQLRKNVPHSHIMSIRSDRLKMQLEEVVKKFNVVIEESDIFARCCECNCCEFMTFDPQVLSKAKTHKGRSAVGSKLVSVNEGKTSFNIIEGVTDEGLKVRVEEVPYGVLNRVPLIYVCSKCGKCYWDGTHMERMRANVSHVIKH
ncbi:Exonuclease mut-7-like protein [Armadillidium nasatum]|uniref:Exonuclease mut-7-like protein n=1 Tax=Armadillidium nasatum TaxID=96803 RepID=A0A5N5SZN3_9CRUS|nr:Exonuclease mut-7-like protein [Armadillidium nasatum]